MSDKIVPSNPDEPLVIDLGGMKLEISRESLMAFLPWLEEATEDMKQNPIGGGFILAAKGMVPFVPMMVERQARTTSIGPMVEKWDRKHGGKDSLVYMFEYMTKLFVNLLTATEWDIELELLDGDGRRARIKSIRPRNPERIGLIRYVVERVPAAEQVDSSEPIGYLGAPGDSRIGEDNVWSASSAAPVADVPSSEEVYP